MEREIKFKAKRLDNGMWVVGDLLHRITDTCIAVREMDDIVYYPVNPQPSVSAPDCTTRTDVKSTKATSSNGKATALCPYNV